jgi:exodeoxyribonuclease-5
MHAAKGLEWPIVVPINTMTQIMVPENAVTDRASGHFYCPVFGVKPNGYETARDAEKTELDRERIRLWYVAATRARELLVLPRLDVAARSSAWISLLDLSLPDLPSLDVSHFAADTGAGATAQENGQTREIFAAEAAAIAARQRRIVWLVPSRDEFGAGPVLEREVPGILLADPDGESAEENPPINVQGGRERGLLLHKLIEEVLTGETGETEMALRARAVTLIYALNRPVVDDPAQGLAPAELASTVMRALALPEIAALRPSLMPEFPVYASVVTEQQEEATAGIADAIAFSPDGAPQVVVDWKSDVDPAAEVIERYRAQVGAYLEMTDVERGLIVLVTPGAVITVTRMPQT